MPKATKKVRTASHIMQSYTIVLIECVHSKTKRSKCCFYSSFIVTNIPVSLSLSPTWIGNAMTASRRRCHMVTECTTYYESSIKAGTTHITVNLQYFVSFDRNPVLRRPNLNPRRKQSTWKSRRKEKVMTPENYQVTGGTQTIGYLEKILFDLRRSQSRQKGKAPSSEHYTNTDGVPPHKKPKPVPKDNRKKDPTYAPPSLQQQEDCETKS